MKRLAYPILILLCIAAQLQAQTRNPAACKINNENWCGSGSLAGYWTDQDGRSGALILTNAHVATTKLGDRMLCTFVMGNGEERAFDGFNLIAAYSNRNAVDWAIVFCPGLTAESGIEPLKLSKKPQEGLTFQFTGSPNCIWPQSSVAIRLVESSTVGVVKWVPITIGGQSGSCVRRDLGNNRFVGEILLTWAWNGFGAGQPTSLIYSNIQNKSSAGPARPEGLIEVATGRDRQCEEGFHEAAEIRAAGVADLPIWYDGVIVLPDDELTEEEITAAKSIKANGYSLPELDRMLKSIRKGPLGIKQWDNLK